MRKKTGYEGRREQLIHTITDAIHDCKTRRVYHKEFLASIPPLIKELREIEEKMEVENPEWVKLQKSFSMLLSANPLKK